MNTRKRWKLLGLALVFSVALAGCEELLGGMLDFGLQDYIDNLEDGELTVTVTGLNGSDFDRADVWVEPIDVDEFDLELDDLDDDDAVEQAVQDWVDDHDAPDDFPSEIYAGYGSEDPENGTFSEKLATDASVDGGGISNGDETTLEGNIYVVYVVLSNTNNNGSAEIGVTFAIVDSNEEVTLEYDDDEFEDFGDD